ncbi:FkbM family methyltransferase [Azospirillum sp.]|uniref:FkbM family methyltransferase n=1 Tax=Azospirillum sp. TaxID=34012 RepID=UPI003D748163
MDCSKRIEEAFRHQVSGKIQEAIALYEIAHKGGNGSWESYFNLGSCYYHVKNYLSAAKCYAVAMEHKKNDDVIRNNLAHSMIQAIRLGQLQPYEGIFVDDAASAIASVNSLEEQIRNFVFDKITCSKKEVVFAQVGANDGVSHNPICRHVFNGGWKGVMIEPTPRLFEILKYNYRNTDVACLNLCVGQESGRVKFYAVKHSPDIKNNIVYQINSLDRSFIIKNKHLFPSDVDIDELIEEIPVDMRRLDDVLRDLGFAHLDILVVDAESYDYQVLASACLEKYKPEAILYEAKNLSENDRISAEEMLKSLDYSIVELEADSLALRCGLMTQNEIAFISSVAAHSKRELHRASVMQIWKEASLMISEKG